MRLCSYPFFPPFFLLQCLIVLTNLSFTCCCLCPPFLPHIIGLFHCPSPQVSFMSTIYSVLFLLTYLSLDATWRITQGAKKSQEHKKKVILTFTSISPWSKEKAVTLRICSVVVVLKPESTECKWHLQNSTKLPRSVHPLYKSPIAWIFVLSQTLEKSLFLLQYVLVIISLHEPPVSSPRL